MPSKQKSPKTPGPVARGVTKVSKTKKGTKKRKAPSFELVRDPGSGQMTIVGRPAWSTRGKRIKVNQIASKGELEDRRHMLHWEEQLKPVLESVFSALAREHPGNLHEVLAGPLQTRKWKAIPRDSDGVMRRVVVEINGAAANLVPDRADINKAIEHVRANIRGYAESLLLDPDFSADASALPQVIDPTRMGNYKKVARLKFPVGDTSTPIRARMSDIHAMLLEHIDGCTAPCGLWELLHHLEYSVTFDLSEKATRDKTSRMLAWQRTMLNMEYSPAEKRYEALLSLLD